MNQRDIINKLLDDVTDSQLVEVADFLTFLRLKNDKASILDIEAASLSSTDFWNNADDEAWDNV